jgi:putative ABC transport system substrate-binding protein
MCCRPNLKALLTSLVLFAASEAPAQNLTKLGLLTDGFEPSELGISIQKDLRALGLIEGRNIHMEFRGAARKLDRLDPLAEELVRLNVAVIIAVDPAAALAAKDKTRSIPIVLVGVGNPVETGLVTGFSRPGGNISGVGLPLAEFGAKQLELLREAMGQHTGPVAVLWNKRYPGGQLSFDSLTQAAKSLSLELVSAEITDANELQNVFSGFITKRVRAVVVLPDPITSANEGWIAMLSTKGQLLSISGARSYAEYGGLLAYGPVLSDLSARAAAFVVKILNGAKPSDLPVEEPSRFQLTVNRRTAEFFNLNLPTSILVRADEVIE